jgi:hypothetical protein
MSQSDQTGNIIESMASSGNIDCLLTLWRLSSCSKDVDCFKDYINANLESLSSALGIREKFETFPELVIRYDELRIVSMYKNDVKGLIGWLSEAKGKRIHIFAAKYFTTYYLKISDRETAEILYHIIAIVGLGGEVNSRLLAFLRTKKVIDRIEDEMIDVIEKSGNDYKNSVVLCEIIVFIGFYHSYMVFLFKLSDCEFMVDTIMCFITRLGDKFPQFYKQLDGYLPPSMMKKTLGCIYNYLVESVENFSSELAMHMLLILYKKDPGLTRENIIDRMLTPEELLRFRELLPQYVSQFRIDAENRL